MALQAEQIDVAHSQHVNICASVRNMTGRASFDLHGLMLEDERTLFIGMAGKADDILSRRGAHLLRSDSTVDVVTVRALHQALVYAMVEGHLELGLLLQVAGIAKLRLRFD